MSSGGIGALPFGSGSFGTGDAFVLDIDFCIVRGANEIWVAVESLSGLRAPEADSELNAKNWKLTALSLDGFPRLVQSVASIETEGEADDAGASILFDLGLVPALRIFTDGPLSPNETYTLSYTGIGGQNCEITALQIEPQAYQKLATQDLGTIEDFRNPQISRDKLPLGSLGSYNITDSGDISIDNGEESLRKRILRRITTSVSGFYHLPGYGTDMESKSAITPDLARRIKDRVRGGVREEPDVISAKTNVYPVRGEEGMVVVQVTATTIFGGTITVSEQVRVSG